MFVGAGIAILGDGTLQWAVERVKGSAWMRR